VENKYIVIHACRLHKTNVKDRASHHFDIITTVVKVTQELSTPFKNKIPSWGLMLQWFKKHNPNLSLHVPQGLKVGCAKGLCLKTMLHNML